MKRALVISAVVAVVFGCWWWIFTHPSQNTAPSSPIPTASIAGSPQTPVTSDDKQSAKRSAEIVLRAFFTSPTTNRDRDIRPYAVDSLLEELKLRQKGGTLPGLSVKVDSVSILDTVLPHEDEQIVLSGTVKWSVLVDGKTTERNTSTAIVTLVYDKGWRVARIQELEGSPNEGD